MVAGANLIAGFAIINATAEGDGELLTKIGTYTPFIQGALLIWAGAPKHAKDTLVQTLSNRLSNPDKELEALFEKPSKSKNVKSFLTKPFKKVAAFVNDHPVLTGACIEAPGIALASAGKVMSEEYIIAMALALFVCGNAFLASSDPVFNKSENNPNCDLSL